MSYNVYSLPDTRTVLYHPDVGTANLHQCGHGKITVFRGRGPDFPYHDGGRVCGREQAEKHFRDDHPGNPAELRRGLVSAPVGSVAEKQQGSLAQSARDPDDPGQCRGFFGRVHRGDAAESPGPGFRPDRDEPDLYAFGNDGYGAVMSRHCGLFSAKIHDFITSEIPCQ